MISPAIPSILTVVVVGIAAGAAEDFAASSAGSAAELEWLPGTATEDAIAGPVPTIGDATDVG